MHDLPASIKAIVDKNPTLAFLREARALSWENGLLVLGFPKEFMVERAKDLRERLQALFLAELGGPLSLDLTLDAKAAVQAAERESLEAVEERARSTERIQRRKEAMEHQALKLVRDVFGEVSFQEPELEAEAKRP